LGAAYRRHNGKPLFQSQWSAALTVPVRSVNDDPRRLLICRVFTLSAHTPESLQTILTNALASYPSPLAHLPPELIPFLADVADGDARQALNGLELALKVCESSTRQTTLDGSMELDEDGRKKRDAELMDAVRKGLRKGYDRTGEERYDMISAMHKCIRGSDGSAAMYWLAR